MAEQNPDRIKACDALIISLNPGKELIKERKIRTDKGMCRAKYATNLPRKYIEIINRANRKRLEVTLTLDEFNSITSYPCTFCGTTNNIAIDRKDSSEGYVFDNCQPCCGVCNNMKMLLSNEGFIKQVTKIYKQFNSVT